MTEDELIDRADKRIPHASPEEAAARRPWDRIVAMLRELPDVPAMPPGWEDRAVARWQRRRRRIRLAIAAVVLVWTAAAIALLA